MFFLHSFMAMFSPQRKRLFVGNVIRFIGMESCFLSFVKLFLLITFCVFCAFCLGGGVIDFDSFLFLPSFLFFLSRGDLTYFSCILLHSVVAVRI